MYNIYMDKKAIIEKVMVQGTAILLSALCAALLAFIQSVIADGGVCPRVDSSVAEVGFFGAVIKTAHSAFTMNRNT